MVTKNSVGDIHELFLKLNQFCREIWLHGLQKHDLDPRQLFTTALTIDGLNASKCSTIESRRIKLSHDLSILYINACKNLGITEKQPDWTKLAKNEDCILMKNCPGSLSDLASIQKWNASQVNTWEEGLKGIRFQKALSNDNMTCKLYFYQFSVLFL